MSNVLDKIYTKIPRIHMGRFPSPLIDATELLDPSTVKLIFKHDGVCSDDYAGNKVRKLEFLLAEAQQQQAKHIVTLGSAGSNHAVATSTYARKLGLDCTVCMVDQPPSSIAAKNLRRHLHLNTQLKMFDRLSQATQYAQQLCQDPDYYLVPLGGSSPLASLGFILAVSELRQQLEEVGQSMPSRIYVACGTMGTAVGMTLGLKLLNISTTVVAVRVTEKSVANPDEFAKLYTQSVDLLNTIDPQLNLARTLTSQQVIFEQNFFGKAYAAPTHAAKEAIRRADKIGFELEGTYTGKALSALIAHAEAGQLDHQTVLFWNTLNANDTPLSGSDQIDTLGPRFAKYFK